MRGLIKFILFVALLAGFYYARDAFIRNGIKQESLSFVVGAVENITQNWDKGELERNADATLRERTLATGSAHALDFAYFGQLGQRTSEVACRLDDYVRLNDATRRYISANYTCAAVYQHGVANTVLTILRTNEYAPWRIAYFDVSSPYLEALGASR